MSKIYDFVIFMPAEDIDEFVRYRQILALERLFVWAVCVGQNIANWNCPCMITDGTIALMLKCLRNKENI